jgi:hypothetical protein
MSRKPGRRVRRTDKQWNAILRRFAASGLSIREFCRREGVSLSSLQRRRHLARSPAATGFVELVPASSPPVSGSTWSLELTLPSGVCVRLRG